MSNYDFRSLSAYDFELLAQDLLQRDLGVRLEGFAPGPDGGLDMRYFGDYERHLVVQCKHFVGSSYGTLLSAMKREKAKLASLSPSRYILVTSVPMTPSRKAELSMQLTPYCTSQRDIYGPEDLSNLLGQNADIEERHFKLWLTNTKALTHVMRAGVFNESQREVEHIKRRLSRYVDNASFPRAMEILDREHVCIITGIPGIGKTTLAQILVMRHADAGYQAIRLWENVGEARDVFDPSKLQVFYYDDFLGKTGLDIKLGKNEDERLIRFMADVRRSKNSRFILTTREYILKQAVQVYEALAQVPLDIRACAIQLDDYSPLIRAKILYNHLYFSDLPDEYLDVFRVEQHYQTIIRHRNFSPRIIERMTELFGISNIAPNEYLVQFRENLDAPGRVWELAFKNHLSQTARHLLECLSSLFTPVRYSDLREIFFSYRSFCAAKYNSSWSTLDFERALKELEGNFTRSALSGREITVDFHNPSIQDFMEMHLQTYPDVVKDLVESAIVPDQMVRMQKILGEKITNPGLFVEAIIRTFGNPSRRLYVPSNVDFFWENGFSRERLFLVAHQLWKERAALTPLILQLESMLLAHVETKGIGDSEDAVEVMSLIADGQVPGSSPCQPLFQALYNRLLEHVKRLPTIDDYEAWGRLLSLHPGLVSSEDEGEIRDHFVEFATGEVEGAEDPTTVDLDELDYIADLLNADISDIHDMVEDFRAELKSLSEDQPLAVTRQKSTLADEAATQDEIRSLFANLRKPN